jgi:hypothetical protein
VHFGVENISAGVLPIVDSTLVHARAAAHRALRGVGTAAQASVAE